MNKKIKNGFHFVNNKYLLKQVIKFLKKGFRWNKKLSHDFYDRLTSQKSNEPYGAILVENSKIVIAILLFHQGWSKKEKKQIINLSAWFALKSHRGIKAIMFADKLTKALDNKIITNYSPNAIGLKIYKLLNYSNMSVDKFNIGPSKKFPFFNLFDLFKILGFDGLKILPLKNLLNLKKESYKNYIFYKIHSNKILNIKFNILQIFILNYGVKINFFNFLKLIFKYRILKINIFYRSKNPKNTNLWLIKNHKVENYIFPINSEIMW